MAIIQKKFKTKHTATEMKNAINTKILPNPALSAILESVNWVGNTLHVDSKLGKRTFSLFDYLIEIYIELTLFGSIARKTIEDALDREFKQLTD